MTLILLVLVLSGGCTSCSVSSPIKIHLQGAEALNQDENQVSLPVMVRVYQLSDIDKFERASFADLWKKDRETLGDSLLAAKETTLSPKTSLHFSLPQEERAKYLAMIAIFRNPAGNQWRVVKPVTHALRLTTQKLKVSNSTIELK